MSDENEKAVYDTDGEQNPRAKKNEDGTVTLTLVESVYHGKEEVKELVLIKPRAKHLRNMPAEGLQMKHILDLAGTLARQPKSVIDNLCIEDFQSLGAVVSSFL